jgi:hypothetical protein
LSIERLAGQHVEVVVVAARTTPRIPVRSGGATRRSGSAALDPSRF